MNLLLIEDHADIAANITEFFEGWMACRCAANCATRGARRSRC